MARRWALLVSADSTVLGEMEAALRDTGLHVTTSPNAVHGAAQARDLKPALIISDAEFSAGRPAAIPFILIGGAIDPARLRAQALEMANKPAPAPTPGPAAAEAAVPEPAPKRTSPQPKRWILVVGSDPATPSIVEMSALGLGLEVATANGAEQAVVQARTLKPEVIVCDLDLPGFSDGPAVLREFRGEPAMSFVPFIFIGARAADLDLMLLLKADAAVRFIKKPLDSEMLRTQVWSLSTGEPVPEALASPSAGKSVKTGVAFVLDADPVARGVLDGALDDLGLEATVVEPAEALRLATDLRPALIVSDLLAPGAVDFMAELRLDALLSGIPFLFIADLPVDKAMGMLPWGDATVRFTKKPLDVRKLKAVASELTGRADTRAA